MSDAKLIFLYRNRLTWAPRIEENCYAIIVFILPYAYFFFPILVFTFTYCLHAEVPFSDNTVGGNMNLPYEMVFVVFTWYIMQTCKHKFMKDIFIVKDNIIC